MKPEWRNNSTDPEPSEGMQPRDRMRADGDGGEGGTKEGAADANRTKTAKAIRGAPHTGGLQPQEEAGAPGGAETKGGDAGEEQKPQGAATARPEANKDVYE